MYELLLEYIETRILRNVVISCCIMYFVVNYVVTMIKPKIHGNFYQIIYVIFHQLALEYTLLYKVPSNSTGKNFVANVFYFVL